MTQNFSANPIISQAANPQMYFNRINFSHAEKPNIKFEDESLISINFIDKTKTSSFVHPENQSIFFIHKDCEEIFIKFVILINPKFSALTI